MGLLIRRKASWDQAMPALGLILLFLEVSPRPVFGLDLESARVLLQFPLVGLAFLVALERKLVPAITVATILALLQASPCARALLAHAEPDLETLFPPVAWILMLGSYAYPARREVYLGKPESKEPQA